MSNRLLLLPAILLLALLAAAPAHAADPGRWAEVRRSPIPIFYYQGVAAEPGKSFFFDGISFGLYRTSLTLTESAKTDNVIPTDVSNGEGYNHIGDIAFDTREGGRVLLPMECYSPGAKPSANTCGTGSIAVADPNTLVWRYYVKLDPRYIAKAMWAEVSPDGGLIWTSSGDDLLAYRTNAVKPGHAAPAGPLLKPAVRLRGAVPPTGITGATFHAGRLFVAGQDGDLFQVWSIDLSSGARRLEIERTVVGESEGLDTADALGGLLHWQIQPYNEQGLPTYPPLNATLLHFLPAPSAAG